MKLIAGEELRARLADKPPLVEHLIDAETQIQVNGIDFTVREVAEFSSEPGAIDFDNSERRTPRTTPVPTDGEGWWQLPSGTFWILYNELVNIPADIFAMARTRSSLLRSGAQIGTALWDSGYSGRSGSLLSVQNPAGIRLRKNARVLQLVFFGLDVASASTYSGRYQNENK